MQQFPRPSSLLCPLLLLDIYNSMRFILAAGLESLFLSDRRRQALMRQHRVPDFDVARASAALCNLLRSSNKLTQCSPPCVCACVCVCLNHSYCCWGACACAVLRAHPAPLSYLIRAVEISPLLHFRTPQVESPVTRLLEPLIAAHSNNLQSSVAPVVTACL